MGQVVEMNRRAAASALERLNRLTGLEFEGWPESLLRPLEDDQPSPRTTAPAVLQFRSSR